MAVKFQFVALPKERFHSLIGLSDENELAMHNAKWMTVDSNPGYPCRVSLIDAEIGEKVLALSFFYHDVNSPYKASGPIFVRENSETAKLCVNDIPKMLRHRLLSVRAYDSANIMIEAEVLQGTELKSVIERQFKNTKVEYIHIHNANPGCFNCAVHRA